jgi:hypothetical protein
MEWVQEKKESKNIPVPATKAYENLEGLLLLFLSSA